MNHAQTYQVMPPLSLEEYEALKADIIARGVQVAVEFDDQGNILDGFHRVQICEELGIDYPKRVRSDLTDADKRAHAWTLNLTRRHLSKTQKRAIALTLRQEGWTQERIAQVLALSQATISSWLHEFIRSDELPQPETILGKDGKRYPPKKARQPLAPWTDETDGEYRGEPSPPPSISTPAMADAGASPDNRPIAERVDTCQPMAEGPGYETTMTQDGGPANSWMRSMGY